MGFLPVMPVVKAGLAAWTAYQLYATGRDMVHDAKVQESWKKGKYIDREGHIRRVFAKKSSTPFKQRL